ncbi:MAG: ester cyclase [Polyangiales bacterium]
MPRDLTPILKLWTEPVPEDTAAASRAFAEYYADPVLVNGTPLPCSGLVERARAQQRAFTGLRIELLEQVETPEHVAIAFRQSGRHTGPLATPLGEVPATGRQIERMVMDILKFQAGRVTEIHVVGDELGLLVKLDAVTLKERP